MEVQWAHNQSLPLPILHQHDGVISGNGPPSHPELQDGILAAHATGFGQDQSCALALNRAESYSEKTGRRPKLDALTLIVDVCVLIFMWFDVV